MARSPDRQIAGSHDASPTATWIPLRKKAARPNQGLERKPKNFFFIKALACDNAQIVFIL
ncbi:MAG: hypothetical protein ACI83P_000881 [Janthinobacterium sp.]|jgi:hypothetical protein